ncbi:tyrosine-type recombinase/integrase [Oscillatoria amoena NRMC-F 0135]|nr:tyrosine-type recombinase/integrase [Oscillatoria amoena NRMC-F 0135]
MKLTNIKCQNTKPSEKTQKLFDGRGLFLEIRPNGAKYWCMKYRFMGKEKLLALGVYPEISLAEAREKCLEARKTLDKNHDPASVRKQERQEAKINVETTFRVVAMEWYEKNKDTWSRSYREKVIKGLNLNVFPFIGNRPIREITPPELLNNCLRRIENRGSLDIAGRTRQICGQIFRYGIQTGRCDWNAADNLQGALKTRKTEHFRALELNQVPDFLKVLERNEIRLFERTRRAIWLSLYTFCRPAEIRQARWQDINFEDKIWVIPAMFMKARKDHMVPLSNQAIDILLEQRKEVEVLNTEWVFPSQIRPKEPMSDGTVNKAIKRLGYGKEAVAHGFRALARTTIREKLKYDSEIIEKQLAHKTNNPLGEAYDRTQFLPERFKMMQDWADYLQELLKK